MSGDVEELDKNVGRKYQVQTKLGKGAYGIVWKATKVATKETVGRSCAVCRVCSGWLPV